MAKNKAMKNQHDDDLDFSEYLEPSFEDESMILDGMNNLIEASNNQMMLAIELTKLVVTHTDGKGRNVEEVFAIFQKASELVAENLPLKSLLERFTTCH